MGPRAARRSTSGDDGASAVEFALLLPVFAMLAIGTISGGFAFHNWLSATHGAQESSRFAATLSIDAGGGSADLWLDEVTERSLSASGLLVDDTHAIAGTSACVALIAPGNFPQVARHVTVTTASDGLMTRSYAGGACPGLAVMTGDYVQVRITIPTDFNYLLAAATIDITGKSVNRFEAISLS